MSENNNYLIFYCLATGLFVGFFVSGFIIHKEIKQLKNQFQSQREAAYLDGYSKGSLDCMRIWTKE